ncbi:MAG: hypothetical protein ABSC95_23665 [Acetobacteraceae bacterium]|jgi:hypothetical protein
MVTMTTQMAFREVQALPFCYVCGRDFTPTDNKDRDHIPAKAVFDKRDRMPALWLPTHKACNAGHGTLDQKIGQLVALKRHQVPTKRDRQLRFRMFRQNVGAIENLDIRSVVWRWVRGFHAALYREPLPATWFMSSLQTPFPSGTATIFGMKIDPLPQQHLAFVETIKVQRAKRNLDTIRSNNGKLTYECVWHQADNGGPWLCIFALNLYDWKDLGVTPGQPARGCAGFYKLPSGMSPGRATRTVTTSIIIPNVDRLDPFAP